MANFPNIRYFAHRGASKYAPEKTIAAFEMARIQGAPGVELDVKLTKDRIPVVMHDQTLDRTTTGSGPIQNYSLQELSPLSAQNGMEKFRGVKIPTLDEVIDHFSKSMYLNIELTNYASLFDGLAFEVIKCLDRHAITDGVILSSFAVSNLVIVKAIRPKIPTGYLFTQPRAVHSLVASGLNSAAEHPYHEFVTEEIVRQTHENARRIHVWTVNEPDRMRQLAYWGVDSIFTDDPIAANRYFGI